MNEWISQSAYFSVVLTLGVYFIGCAIQKKIKAFNPFLFSVVVIVVLLAVFHIDYQIYYDGNEIGKYGQYFAVCTAVWTVTL